MPLDRRTFLRRTSLALAGGLIVGDAALELFERLTHQKVFALGDGWPEGHLDVLTHASVHGLHVGTWSQWQIDDTVGLFRAGKLVTNGIGTITHVDGGTITVAWNA